MVKADNHYVAKLLVMVAHRRRSGIGQRGRACNRAEAVASE
jgi:hypothetical protein